MTLQISITANLKARLHRGAEHFAALQIRASCTRSQRPSRVGTV